MANFQEQVEGLTGLSIDSTSSPTLTELSQFLKDGATDVINKLIRSDKFSAMTFGEVTTESGNGTIINGPILDVWGTDGTNDHPADLVSLSDGKRAADTSSLSYRSKYNPCYFREGKKVIVKPDGGSVLHISYPSVTYNQETIYNMPNQYTSLVAMYAAIRALGNYLSTLIMPLDIGDETFAPIESIDYDNNTLLTTGSSGASGTGAYPGSTITAPTNSTAGSWEDMLKGLVRPTYVKPNLPDNFQAAITTFIDDEEDTELSAAKQKQQELILEEYQTEIQNELNRYNMENAAYQKEVEARLLWFNAATQPSASTKSTTAEPAGSASGTSAGQSGASAQTNIAEAQLKFQRELQERTLKIQKYGAEVQKISAEYQIFQSRQNQLMQEYMLALDAEAQPAYDAGMARGAQQKEQRR